MVAEAYERLSPALQYQVANVLGWSDLRPVQKASIHAILDGANCVILAPTAGGKTEAALLPLLSQMDREDWPPISVLYLAPIRALLNNQEARLERLTGLVGRRAGKWHGDVSASTRRRISQAPPDLLAITPESLEAMLLSTRVPARRLLGQVRAVVVDEVHTFAGDDRGAHLVALLERVTRVAGADIQRVGLSATVGDPEVIAGWLSGSSLRPQRVVDPGGPRTSPEIHIDHVGSLDNAARLVDELYPKTRRLVFVDSRRRVEELGYKLAQRGVQVYLAHSSLALAERTAAERAFEEGSNCVIVATSALELGIDVGDLDHVLQIDAPSTVSAFLQRMGRTGRRPGARANCTFLATDEDAVLQAAALVELFEEGFVEPAVPPTWTPHILAHQIIALALQETGVPKHAWWQWVEGCAAFGGLSANERTGLVAHMIQQDILNEVDSRLTLGPQGEKLYGKRNFLELYAVFSTPRTLRVLYGPQEIGVIDAFFLQDGSQDRSSFVLSGRPWRVLAVDWRSGTCSVEPTASGKYPRWHGQPVLLSRALCQAMLSLLADGEARSCWSKRAQAAMDTVREQYAGRVDGGGSLVLEPEGRFRWWTFAGGRGNRVLANLLEDALGAKVSANNVAVTFDGESVRSELAICQAIAELAAQAPIGWEHVAGLENGLARTRVSKFQPCLPPEMEQGLIARETMDVGDANAAVEASRYGFRAGRPREA